MEYGWISEFPIDVISFFLLILLRNRKKRSVVSSEINMEELCRIHKIQN